ncbi:MAG: hypothetical protein M1822_000105 [Bathelium mastoideum]|nr:MAG: hypothetical protein M1822_000105 [Bathelium mastoideum]
MHKPTLQDQRNTINTVIDDEPQEFHFSFDSKYGNIATTVTLGSPMYDDFPTPRGPKDITAESPSSVGSSTCTSDSEWARARRSPDFEDELYDVSDDDDMEVPLKISNSVKSTLQRKKRIPSITIPSPTTWPTIEKLQKAMKSPVQLSPPPKLDIPPAALAKLDTSSLQVPTRISTPSLDGSQTGDDTSSSACPSTPDLSAASDSGHEWDAPLQLHPEAMETLHQISPELHQAVQPDQPLEIHPPRFQEMQQLTEEQRRQSIPGLTPVEPAERADDPISALSVPSPGGFFSSLDASARHTWCLRQPTPTTGTAESFYGVPWRTNSDETVKQVIEVSSSGSPTDGPPTARRIPFSVDEVVEVSEIRTTEINYEYNENYDAELAQQASANFDRTSLWLAAQSSYLSALRDTNPANEKGLASPMAPLAEAKNGSPVSPPSRKKSVRFIDGVPKTSSHTPGDKSEKTPSDPTFYQGFQHLRKGSTSRDALHHGQHRVEALHLKRQCLAQAYRNQLQGKYELNDPLRPTTNRPVSSFLPNPTDAEEEKAMIAAAEKERQALEQLQPSAWNLEATRILNGGRLLNSPVSSLLAHPDARVLELGGEVTCDWGWAIALTHRNATVYSVAPSDISSKKHLRGPRNHRRLSVSNLWTLPFPSNHFDVISTRSLHAHLKTAKPSTGGSANTTPTSTTFADEYDLCLAECLRVLKPGGYLEFSLLDAELLRPSPLGAALGVEFAFNLRTRGYDPSPARSFLRRLARTGFRDVKRAWMVLPMADATPRWTDRGKRETVAMTAAAAAMRAGLAEAAVDARPRALRSQSDGTIGVGPNVLRKKSAIPNGPLPPTPQQQQPRTMRSGSDGGVASVLSAYGVPEQRPQTVRKGSDATGLSAGTARSLSTILEIASVIDDDEDEEEAAGWGSTRAAAGVTGIVGAWAWERWMLKLQMEMGREEERLLEGVSKALEEGGKCGSGWRCLTGWARKPMGGRGKERL